MKKPKYSLMTSRSTRKFRKLDVRPVLQKGDSPFPVIMAKVDTLRPAEGLELTAPFMPAPLVELLGSRGFESKMERGDDGSWICWFWKEK